MNKQWTKTLGLLTLSALLVGCNSSESSKETIVSEETTISSEETVETEAPLETSDEENTLNEEISSNDESALSNSDSNIKENESETADTTVSKEDFSNNHTTVQSESTTQKPQGSTSAGTSKPQGSTSTGTSKPQSSTSTGTSKPQGSTSTGTSKPQDSTSTGTSKPQTTPTPGPAPETPKPDVSEPAPVSLSCSSIFDQISNGMDTSSHQTMDDTLLQDFYGIDTSLLEDHCVKMPMMSFSITEVGVFKVKDTNNVNNIVNAINKRANDIGIMLYPSLEETYNRRQVVTKGQYILFVISDDVDTIVENFNALV